MISFGSTMSLIIIRIPQKVRLFIMEIMHQQHAMQQTQVAVPFHMRGVWCAVR